FSLSTTRNKNGGPTARRIDSHDTATLQRRFLRAGPGSPGQFSSARPGVDQRGSGKRLEGGRRPSGHGRHHAPPSIELGNEPPLGLDGDVEEPIDRRRVSIRWLAATVLAAIAGGGLMGGAVFAALDGEYRFAQVPEFARQALRAAGDRISNATRKADRMSLMVDFSTARQVLRVSTTTRVQDREIVRVRPFI